MNSQERSALPPNFPNTLGQTCKQGMYHPKIRILEFVRIKEGLELRINTPPKNHVAIFPNAADRNPPTVTSYKCVRLPIDLEFDYSCAPERRLDGIYNPQSKWSRIVEVLLKLKDTCESGKAIPNVAKLMHDTVELYCPNVNAYSNFDVLNNTDIGKLVIRSIPTIILLAIQLPILLSKQIPILESSKSRTIYATRKLCASLLANAFLCTFPDPETAQSTPDFNFFKLFDTSTEFATFSDVKREKLKCILNYFEIISKDEKGHHQIVSFERRCISQKTVWVQRPNALCDVKVDSEGKIEYCNQMLQVDFANKVVGGGVYRDTCVMEDIRFCISPELLVARLFSQDLEDNDVLVVTGSEIFSEYEGYANNFKYKGPIKLNFNQAVDSCGRTYIQMVAMDARFFRKENKKDQFEEEHLDRELHKCNVAFTPGKNYISPVASGNWGCGQFNGDKELKFLIQWMAVSIHDRPLLQFHIISDQEFSRQIEEIKCRLRSKNVTVGKLYKMIRAFHKDYKKYGEGGIFKYIRKKT